MSGVRDEVVPGERWAFDEHVAEAFDDMLERSIPQYATMRGIVHDLAVRYARPYSAIVDLGCSRGGALAALVGLGTSNRFFGIDVAEPMLAAARARFANEGGRVAIENFDLRRGYPDVGAASVTLAVLTLQFVPINYRQRIIRDVFEHTLSGGVFLVVEKVLGDGPGLDEAMVALYHRKKLESGYSLEDVVRKAASLEGVLVPATAGWNEELLRKAGFAEVDCVWRWLNFAAWAAVRR